MSGVKTKTVPIDTYNRILSDANKARDAEKRARTAEEKARAEKAKNDKLLKDLAAQDRYHGQMARRIDALSIDLQKANATASETKKQLINTVNSTNAALKKQQDDFSKAINQTRNDFANAMEKNNKAIENVINKNNEVLRGEINKLRSETNTRINDLQKNIAEVNKKVGDPAATVQAAQDNIDVAIDLLDKVKELRDEMLLPGRKAEVFEKINEAVAAVAAAKSNPANSSAALIRGQDAFKKAHDFYQDLITAENEWASKLSATLQALSAAEEEIEESKIIRIENLVDHNGNAVPAIQHDTDHWSNGGLTELTNTVNALKQTLNSDNAKTVSVDELDSITSQAQLIADEANSIMGDSFCSINLSSERNKQIKIIGEELVEKCGLTTRIQAGYEGKDSRAASIMHLRNDATGFEACIILSTDFENGKPEIKADTTIINKGNNQEAADNFDKVLSAIMHKHGFASEGVPIPENKEKAEEVNNWKGKDKKDVTTVQKISASEKARNTDIHNRTATN